MSELKVLKSSEYRVAERLSELALEDCSFNIRECAGRAYLSGSDAYWLNSWFDVSQFRGGHDAGAMSDWWDDASFQIREGSSEELTRLWLELSGCFAVVVHGEDSEDAYHDFRYLDKFNKMPGWEKVWHEKGDLIYANEDNGLAKVADNSLLKVRSPRAGDDLRGLHDYVGRIEDRAEMLWLSNKEFEVKSNVGESQGILVAVPHSVYWRVRESNLPVKVERDPLGFLFILPLKSGWLDVRLEYLPIIDIFLGICLSLVGIWLVVFQPKTLFNYSFNLLHKLVGDEAC